MLEYYRLDVKDGLVSVVSDDDYSDNDRSTYLLDPENKEYYLKFSTERGAKQYLNEKIKEEHIHPDWLMRDLDQAKLFK